MKTKDSLTKSLYWQREQIDIAGVNAYTEINNEYDVKEYYEKIIIKS